VELVDSPDGPLLPRTGRAGASSGTQAQKMSSGPSKGRSTTDEWDFVNGCNQILVASGEGPSAANTSSRKTS
jgi:hypothetical protein